MCKGILTCVALNANGISTASVHTAEFVEFVDNLFDIFNSLSVHDAKCFRRAFNANSDQVKFLTEAKTCLENLKFLNKTGRNPPCISGWITNIAALLVLWEELKGTYSFKFLLTRRLTQDCLENLFSIVRFTGGNNTTPDCSKFRHTLKSVLTNQLLHPSALGNCDMDCAEFLLANNEIGIQRPVIFPRLSPSSASPDLTPALCDSDISANSRAYVTGWVCSRLEHKECRDALCSLEQSCEPRDIHISMKKYTENCKMFFPNDSAMRLATACVNA